MTPTALSYVIRKATAKDDAAIRALVLSERLRPIDLNPENFLVAAGDGEIIGAVQMRHHRDGTHELGSLVVARAWRGQGLAARLVDACLNGQTHTVYMIGARAHVHRYERWGFKPVNGKAVPGSIRLHHVLGSLGSIVSLLKRRPMRRLAILRRDAAPAS